MLKLSQIQLKMNRIKKQFFSIIIIGSAAFFVSCNSSTNNAKKEGVSSDVINISATASGVKSEPGAAPAISFHEEIFDFGKIMQGEKVSYSFVFKNSGGADLVISSAQGSCGCTVPSYPTEPIKPGAEGKINVVFNSEGKSGLVKKTVTIVTNATPSTKILTIASTVVVPEEK